VAPQQRSVGIERTILVQADNSSDDTVHMFAVADRYDEVAGIVGWVPLADPGSAGQALDRLGSDPRFVGVRHLNHLEPDPDWPLHRDVGRGLSLLEERDLTFDIVATEPRHLEIVPLLAERHSGLRIVVDHLGKPPIASQGWQPWADLLAAAAASPNVSAKVSGLNTAASPGWTAADLQPYVDHAVRCFGADRLMFGGDWPVAILNGDYAEVVAETRKTLAALDDDERSAVMGATAVRVYGLEKGRSGERNRSNA
jgi:L-fuconolactonase